MVRWPPERRWELETVGRTLCRPPRLPGAAAALCSPLTEPQLPPGPARPGPPAGLGARSAIVLGAHPHAALLPRLA